MCVLLNLPEIGRLLSQIISGKYAENGMNELVQSGAAAQLFPAELLDKLRAVHGDVATGLHQILRVLPISNGHRSLTRFYQEFERLIPGITKTHPLFKVQIEATQAKRQQDFLTELNDLLEKKSADSEVNNWLGSKCQRGNAAWVFTLLLENKFLPKLFPMIHEHLSMDKVRLLRMMQKIDATSSGKNVLDAVYTHFIVSATQGDGQVEQTIQLESRLKTHFSNKPFSPTVLKEAQQDYYETYPATLPKLPWQHAASQSQPHRNKMFTPRGHAHHQVASRVVKSQPTESRPKSGKL